MQEIQIISAPSILGLRPGGVEKLPDSLLAQGLSQKLGCNYPVVRVPTLNSQYSFDRDRVTQCLNPGPTRSFSKTLGVEISKVLSRDVFPVVLGGDCSILIGILSVLRSKGKYGLLFCDAHADFYQPEKSTTGEIADMDLAIVTGRGPEMLTDIDGLSPYINDEHVIHIGQRDWDETTKFGSQDIKKTAITCFDLDLILETGIQNTVQMVVQKIQKMDVKGFWIHFDTDVLADEENPAVDYRLPRGLSFYQCEQLLKSFLATNQIAGMSVTIFNPDLDDDQNTVAKKLTSLLNDVFHKRALSNNSC